MSTYIEYGVKLTDGQKSKLASAILNKSPLTLRLKHSHLKGSDELMLTKRQISKIKKSIANGTGSDIKISKTQIRRSVKHGGNLFSSLASIGAKVLPYAIKGISKVAPALATGAATALGEVDRRGSSNTANVYVPHPPPPSTYGEGYPYRSPPFIGTWDNPIGMGVKKKSPNPKARVFF